MEYAWTHRSRGADGQLGVGTLFAKSAAEAHFRLHHRLAREPLSIRLAPWQTLRQWLKPGFDTRDLVAFYRAFGRRLERGQAIQPGLEQAQEFVSDPRLIQSVALLAHGLKEGQRLGIALRGAGFPERDAAALDAVGDTGRLPDTLQVLAADLERRAQLARSLRQTLQMPLTVASLLYIGLYFALVFFLPTMARFYHALGAGALPPMAAMLFAFADAFRSHLVLTSVLTLIFPVLLLCVMRTPAVREMWERAPLVAERLERSELASLWAAFATLYDAGIQIEEACRLLHAAATRPSTRRWFAALGRELRAGWPLVKAVPRAGFPHHVIRAVQAADSGGDLVAGLRALADSLTEDVVHLSQGQEHLVRVLATVIAAALVAGFFLLTYYPILASTFSQL